MRKPKFTWDNCGIAICEITDGTKTFIGQAVCHDEDMDMMTEKVGCEIALRRATIEYYRYYRDCLKERLGALQHVYYTMNRSKFFNPRSYEHVMLQKQIRLIKTDLETAKQLIIDTQAGLKQYIDEKDTFYKQIRKNRTKTANLEQ